MISRRHFVQHSSLLGLGVLAVPAAPALVRRDRPELSHGIASGDPTADGGVVWARSDRPARMLVELPDTGQTVRGPALTPETGFTGQVMLRGLPSGQPVRYRVRLEDPERPGVSGPPAEGRLVTAPSRRQDIRFCWSGDMCGQGWGINPDHEGIEIYARMRQLQPDFFLHSGDSVYSDGPLESSVTLPDGRTWRNIVTEEKSKVAETLDEFRGQWAYNLLDPYVRGFNADVPQVNQWDDHEVVNNWYPGEILDDPRYTEKHVDVLAARSRQAFLEWTPMRPQRGDHDGRIYRKISYGPLLDLFVLDMRTYKDANSTNLERKPDGGVFGRRQLHWLIRQLSTSRARWKVIASDLPLGLIVPDGQGGIQEGIAQGHAGAPRGRELEVATLLAAVRRKGIRGMVWLTADVHYTAAHQYSPERASFTDFEPFWEFVSGPVHAGGFGPNELDPTFGPEAVFVQGPPRQNTSPLEGFQNFGEVEISGETGDLTVRLRDQSSEVLYAKTLQQ